MAEYIDKAILLDHLDIENALGGHYGISLTEINKIPAADVRPVVLCRDCRHRDPEDHKCDCGQLERAGCVFPVDNDYYCAYGEKRRES